MIPKKLKSDNDPESNREIVRRTEKSETFRSKKAAKEVADAGKKWVKIDNKTWKLL